MPLRQAADELLGQSDERDQWHKWAWAMWREGYQAGHADGHAAGHREGYEQAVREWKITAAGLRPGGPQWEELDRVRYPPHGRRSWLLPQFADVYDYWQRYCEHDDAAQRKGAA